MTTELSKKQLTTILSALDDAPRNPANRGEALRAIGRSAARLGLTADEVLAAAPGLLDGRLGPADFRTELQAPFVEVDATPAEPGEGAKEAQEPAPAGDQAAPEEPALEAAEAAVTPALAKKPTPRAGTKQARMIEMLERPEGATVEQIAAATGWQHHTIRGAISGALKKKLGLTIEATRTREVGPNKTGAKGGTTVYRIVAPA
jgi:Protein of unknown function (DUF3489)